MKSNLPHTENLNAWQFVEQYYPNYHSCDDIAYSNSLAKIIENGEQGSAGRISEFEATTNKAKIEMLLLNAKIYEKAIQSFLASQIKEQAPRSVEFSSDNIKKRSVELGIDLSSKQCEDIARHLTASVDGTFNRLRMNCIDEAIMYEHINSTNEKVY